MTSRTSAAVRPFRERPPPSSRGGTRATPHGQHDHGRRVDAREAVHEALAGRARGLRLLDAPQDAGQRRLRGRARDAHVQRARAVDGAREHLVAGLPGDGLRLAGQRRLVDVARARARRRRRGGCARPGRPRSARRAPRGRRRRAPRPAAPRTRAVSGASCMRPLMAPGAPARRLRDSRSWASEKRTTVAAPSPHSPMAMAPTHRHRHERVHVERALARALPAACGRWARRR